MSNRPLVTKATHTTATNSGKDGNVTLRVTDKEAAEVAYASDQGKVWLVLRPTAGAKQGGNHPAQAMQTSVAELLAPIPYIIPGQLFAQYLALSKGLNPDQLRSLTKITRTR